MDLMQAMVTRRAVREYLATPVEVTRIEKCIQAPSFAPSAMNRQPWSFVVLTDRRRIEDHSRWAKLWLLSNIEKTPALAPLKPLLEKPEYGAPALVFIARCTGSRRLLSCGKEFSARGLRTGFGNMLDRFGARLL